jgi:hypothetical protein
MIPKIIHWCWLSGDEYPELINNCIRSWKEQCPEYKIMLWDKSFLDIHDSIWVKQAYEAKKYALAADYIRFWALYQHGGIYLDSDVELLKNFNDLLKLSSFIGFEGNGYTLEPAIIGSEAQQEWIGNCCDYYNDRKFISNNISDTVYLPVIINKLFYQTYGLILKDDGSIQPLENPKLTVFPRDYFCPKADNKIIITEHTYSIHHYKASWRSPIQKIKGKIISILRKNIIGRFLYEKYFEKKYGYKEKDGPEIKPMR